MKKKTLIILAAVALSGGFAWGQDVACVTLCPSDPSTGDWVEARFYPEDGGEASPPLPDEAAPVGSDQALEQDLHDESSPPVAAAQSQEGLWVSLMQDVERE